MRSGERSEMLLLFSGRICRKLSRRCGNLIVQTFYDEGIRSVADFANWTEKELLAPKGIGPGHDQEIAK